MEKPIWGLKLPVGSGPELPYLLRIASIRGEAIMLCFCFVFFLLKKKKNEDSRNGDVHDCTVPYALMHHAISSFERVYCCLWNLERQLCTREEQIFLY